jgi:hypothetical protein
VINTELSASWNVGVIAKPTYAEGYLGAKAYTGNTILVGWANIDFKEVDINNSADEIHNEFEIACLADTEANLILILGEVRRIVNAKSLTSTKWHLSGAIPLKWSNYFVFLAHMTERVYKSASAL